MDGSEGQLGARTCSRVGLRELQAHVDALR